MCDALNNNLALKSLDLSYNEIGNAGARSLAQLMPRINLLELRIQGNSISADGMIALFQTLSLVEKKTRMRKKASVVKLKILDMSVNIMQISCLHAFRLMLASNDELCAISLSGLHNFHEKAFSDICQSMSKNMQLQTVDFGTLRYDQWHMLTSINNKRDNPMEQILFIHPPRLIGEPVPIVRHEQDHMAGDDLVDVDEKIRLSHTRKDSAATSSDALPFGTCGRGSKLNNFMTGGDYNDDGGIYVENQENLHV